MIVLGIKHPKQSLDIFLQPLIQDLKDSWSSGVMTYDCLKNVLYDMSSSLLPWLALPYTLPGKTSGVPWHHPARLNVPTES